MSEGRRTHLDLFSGIGGFALAAKWAGFETIAFCEREPFAQRVLRKNFPGVPIIDDVRELDGRDYLGATLLSGGFPCQPFSVSGKRRGSKDDRALGGEMVRIISEARPRWVLAENVIGFATMGLDAMLSDLEGLGYSCEAVVIPACALNAPHRRERIWIVANSEPSPSGLETYPDSGQGRQFSNPSKPKVLSQENRAISSTGNRAGLEDFSHAERPASKWEIEPGVRGMGHGVPDRVDRLQSLGNAIVPQVAFEILRLMR